MIYQYSWKKPTIFPFELSITKRCVKIFTVVGMVPQWMLILSIFHNSINVCFVFI